MPSLARAAAAYEPAGPPPMIRTCVCCGWTGKTRTERGKEMLTEEAEGMCVEGRREGGMEEDLYGKTWNRRWFLKRKAAFLIKKCTCLSRNNKKTT